MFISRPPDSLARRGVLRSSTFPERLAMQRQKNREVVEVACLRLHPLGAAKAATRSGNMSSPQQEMMGVWQ